MGQYQQVYCRVLSLSILKLMRSNTRYTKPLFCSCVVCSWNDDWRNTWPIYPLESPLTTCYGMIPYIWWCTHFNFTCALSVCGAGNYEPCLTFCIISLSNKIHNNQGWNISITISLSIWSKVNLFIVLGCTSCTKRDDHCIF